MSIVKVLPELCAPGAAQMALDAGLLETVDEVMARRYTWSPPALSLGKFQECASVAGLPFEVVRRPTGGRAILHGEGFEWSFAVAFPPGALGPGTRAGADVDTPYDVVTGAFAEALEELGVALDGGREEPYRRSALCFASVLRHDLLARGEKVVAVAQARRAGRVLVHGSVLDSRPPDEMVAAVEAALGEPWQGDGLAGAGHVIAPGMIWSSVLTRLELTLRQLRKGRRA